jgi:pilus assembly protein Flp/PilA
MKKLMRFASRLWKDEEGATAIEYGLLAALVAVAIIGAVTSLSDQLQDTFTHVDNALNTANTGSGDGSVTEE